MMVPRSFAQNPLAQRQRQDFDEKDPLGRRRSLDQTSRSPPKSMLSQSLAQKTLEAIDAPRTNPVTVPLRAERRTLTPVKRPALTALQPIPRSQPTSPLQDNAKRRESAKDILSATTIPIRKKPRPRPAQRLPKGDYVADFSKLLLDDVHSVKSASESTISSSWSNPQFEGLFGNIDGLLEDGQMIVGSEGVDAGILSTRSLSSESMPSLASPDDYSSHDLSSVSPSTVRSPSDRRLRQMASSEDCGKQHPLLESDDEELGSGLSTPELTMASPTKSNRKPHGKHLGSFKSSLTASLKALKSAAQSVSTLASTPPIMGPDDFMSNSFFDFKPSLTDDRRPPPSEGPPSAAMRRYLNPISACPPDSPAQLHFWLDEKPTPGQPVEKPKLKVKKKYQTEKSKTKDKPTSGLPHVVPLATCIPSSIRTATASSPPTWLEPDGTPSNKHRAAQALWDSPADVAKGEGQARPREPRENRDFLRVFVCEMNMRKSGKLSDDAAGHARLWLPPIDAEKDKDGKQGVREKKLGADRWTVYTAEDL